MRGCIQRGEATRIFDRKTKAVYYRILYEKEKYLGRLAGVTDSAQDDVDVIAFSNAYTELCEKISKQERQEAQCRNSRED